MAKTGDVSKALATTKTTSIDAMVRQSVKELGKALPAHMSPERIVRIALTTLRMVPKLRQCEPSTFLAALFQSAQLGLEPNIEGQAYIIPYGNVATFQIGYKGYVELFYRHGLAVSLDAQEVCQNDDFDYEYGTESFLRHKPAIKDRGDVIGYYAVAKLKDGASLFKYMSKEDCMAHGRKHSKAFNSSSSPWQTDPDAMCKKTVVIQIMKLIPKSVEIQKAIAMDNTIKNQLKPDMFEAPDQTDWKGTEDENKGEISESGVSEASPAENEAPEPPEKEDNSDQGVKGGADFRPSSSSLKETGEQQLRDDIVQMLLKLNNEDPTACMVMLKDVTKFKDFAGYASVQELSAVVKEGRKKCMLEVTHSKIKKAYEERFPQDDMPVIDVDE